MEKTEALRFKALLAEQTERYDEMAGFVKELTEINKELDKSERNMLSVAYKNTISPRRSSWRILKQLEEKERNKGNDLGANSAQEYKQTVENELRNTCEEILSIINSLKKGEDPEEQVFYLKLTGDYNRYLAEFSESSAKFDAVKAADDAYQKAVEISKQLDVSNSVRLGTTLNYSVFLVEIQEDKEKAREVASSVIDKEKLENFTSQERTENGLIMRLIQANIAQWGA